MSYLKAFCLIGFGFIMSCHKKGSDPVPTHTNNYSFKILSVSPNSNIQSGVATDFNVEIAYHYETGDSVEINIGFNSDEYGINPGNPVNSAYVVYDFRNVYAHSDTVTFVVNGTVINSGSAGSSFRCFANMAKLPHSGTFTPFAESEKTLTFQ